MALRPGVSGLGATDGVQKPRFCGGRIVSDMQLDILHGLLLIRATSARKSSIKASRPDMAIYVRSISGF
jgi:hypothetical protein